MLQLIFGGENEGTGGLNGFGWVYQMVGGGKGPGGARRRHVRRRRLPKACLFLVLKPDMSRLRYMIGGGGADIASSAQSKRAGVDEMAGFGTVDGCVMVWGVSGNDVGIWEAGVGGGKNTGQGKVVWGGLGCISKVGRKRAVFSSKNDVVSMPFDVVGAVGGVGNERARFRVVWGGFGELARGRGGRRRVLSKSTSLGSFRVVKVLF